MSINRFILPILWCLLPWSWHPAPTTVNSELWQLINGEVTVRKKARLAALALLFRHRTGYHQPARQNVIRKSPCLNAVGRRDAARAARGVRGDASFHMEEHVSHPLDTTSCKRYNSFFSPIWRFFLEHPVRLNQLWSSTLNVISIAVLCVCLHYCLASAGYTVRLLNSWGVNLSWV